MANITTTTTTNTVAGAMATSAAKAKAAMLLAPMAQANAAAMLLAPVAPAMAQANTPAMLAAVANAYVVARKADSVKLHGMASSAYTTAFMASLVNSGIDVVSLCLTPNWDQINTTISGLTSGARYNLLTTALKAGKNNNGIITWLGIKNNAWLKQVNGPDGVKMQRASNMDVCTLLCSPLNNTYFSVKG